MKRNSKGVPLGMIRRWARPPVSCQLCRAKKLRCDRNQPCSNCGIRNMPCTYAAGQPAAGEESLVMAQPRPDGSPPTLQQDSAASVIATSSSSATEPTPAPQPSLAGTSSEDGRGSDDLLARIRKLEEAVFAAAAGSSVGQPSPSTELVRSQARTASSSIGTPFNELNMVASSPGSDYPGLASSHHHHLPPVAHARELFSHFACSVQLTFGVIHLPSAQALMERVYQGMAAGEEPGSAQRLFLLSIFAGAALVWTPQLLEKLGATRAEAKAAFSSYTRLALSLLHSSTAQPVPPCTVALEGICTLAHILTNADGLSDEVHMLRTRGMLMARAIQIHRLDTEKSREERRVKGCDMIEVEVQRRLWWYMVSSDWLAAFSGGPQEGTYMFQSRHMKVNFPSNVGDEFLTASGEQFDFPASVPTSMSAFVQRIRLAQLCYEAVDALPSVLLEPQGDFDYSQVLALNSKIQELVKSLPVFFQLDPASVQQSHDICRERPYIALQRTLLHFSINTRICRLHRPFHLEGLSRPEYAFSRMTCIRAAQTVLELRRSMDDIGARVGLRPSRFWTVTQHVFFAAIILATDVSVGSNTPYEDVRRAEVLDACKMLEKSQEESTAAREAIQTLMSMLRSRPPGGGGIGIAGGGGSSGGGSLRMWAPSEKGPMSGGQQQQQPRAFASSWAKPSRVFDSAPFTFSGGVGSYDSGSGSGIGAVPIEEDWGQLFLNASADWDVPQWNTLFEGLESNLGPAFH